jgi:hypothetical protein
MRLNPRVLVPILGLVVGASAAVQQSPNFSSLTTEVEIATAGSPYALRVTVWLPYREPGRYLLPPVPADEFDEAWPISERCVDRRTAHATEG